MAKQTFTTGQVLLASQLTSLQQTAMLGGAASAKTASYTLVAADAGTAISMTSTSATTITVNTGLFAAGDTVQITNLGSGVSTITAGTATVNTSASLALAQYESGTLDFTSTSAAIFIKGAGAAATGGTPAGTVIFYGKNSAPTGYLKANGAAVSRSTYSDLFTVISTTFGVGDGSTTFNVPDMRGYFARGWVDDGTIDSGRSFGSTQVASALAYNRSGASNFPLSGGSDFDSTSNASGGSGTSGNIETLQFGRVRPYNVALLACIKF